MESDSYQKVPMFLVVIGTLESCWSFKISKKRGDVYAILSGIEGHANAGFAPEKIYHLYITTGCSPRDLVMVSKCTLVESPIIMKRMS